MKDYADRTWAIRPDSEAGRMARIKEMRAYGIIGDPKVRIGSLRDDYLQPLMFKRTMR